MRTSAVRVAVALAAALLVQGIAAAGSRAQDEGDQRLQEGERLYHQYCGACHGVSADGKGALYTLLDPRPADLTRIAARRGGVFPDAKVAAFIDGRDPIASHGARDMPVWGKQFQGGLPKVPNAEKRVTGQVALIVQYLRSIQK